MKKSHALSLASFDVFDTCIIRICGDAKQIFPLTASNVLGEKASNSEISDFTNLRIKGEADAYANAKTEEVSLADIYQFSGITKQFDCTIELCVDAEIRVEKFCWQPVYSIKQKIAEYRLAGVQVAFISDMYLPQDAIASRLMELGILKPNDLLFVSSKFGLTKATGNLFKYISNSHGFQARSWVHFGDNLHSDLKVPRSIGIRATRIAHKASPLESKWRSSNCGNYSIELARVAGISKAIRLSHPKSIKTEFAAQLISPFIVTHLIECLSHATKAGITDIYFVARDGHIFYKLSESLQKQFPQIKFHYFYASRKSLYLTLLTECDPDAIYKIAGKIKGYTVREILDRFNLLDALALDNDTLNTIITQSNESKLTSIFEHNLPAIQTAAKKAKSEFIQYLKAVGMDRIDHNSAIFDLRGSRNCQFAINSALRQIGCKVAFGYYFEVTQDRRSIDDAGPYYSVIGSEHRTLSHSMNGLFELYDLLEQYFCITSQLRTVGYEISQGTVVPKFEDEIDANARSEREAIEGVNYEVSLEFLKSYIAMDLIKSNAIILNFLALASLNQFGEAPNTEYLTALTGFKISDSMHVQTNYISKISFLDLLSHFIKRKPISSGWDRGTISFSFPKLFKVAQLLKKFKYAQ